MQNRKYIVITLDPVKLENFALKELGVILTPEQLEDIPQFSDEDICRAAENAYTALQNRNLGFEIMYESYSRVFLVKLIQKYSRRQIENYDEKRGFTSDKYRTVFQYVKNNFHANIYIEDLADTAAMSPHHFSRLFRETVGKTPMQSVQEHRIEESKSMLKDPNTPLAEIAHRCGFFDQAHFSRVFKKHTSQTPKNYRNSL